MPRPRTAQVSRGRAKTVSPQKATKKLKHTSVIYCVCACGCNERMRIIGQHLYYSPCCILRVRLAVQFNLRQGSHLPPTWGRASNSFFSGRVCTAGTHTRTHARTHTCTPISYQQGSLVTDSCGYLGLGSPQTEDTTDDRERVLLCTFTLRGSILPCSYLHFLSRPYLAKVTGRPKG